MNEKDAKLLKFLQSKNSKFELVNYQFELLNESTVRIIRFEGAGHSTVYEGLVAINEIERTIDRAGFDDVRFCDACGAPMDCGWSDEIGLTHFCSENRDMSAGAVWKLKLRSGRTNQIICGSFIR